MVGISNSRRGVFFISSGIASALLMISLAVDSLHLMTGLLFSTGMLVMAMYRLKWEGKPNAIQLFSVFSAFIFLTLMACLSSVALPLDVASILLMALGPQILVAIINYFDEGLTNEFGHFFKLFNIKMIIQLGLAAVGLILVGGWLPQLIVWPDFSFESLWLPLTLIVILPDIFWQNSQFNHNHTHTLSTVYGSMALSSALLLGFNAHTVVLAAMALTGLFWNSKETVELKSLSWQFIAATSLFVSTRHLMPLASSCAFGIGSAKALGLMTEEGSHLSPYKAI